jgi:hypothetical protein
MPKAEPKKKSASRAGAKTGSPRMRKLTKKQSRTKAKKEIQTRPQIINSFKLTVQVAGIFRQFWKPLGGIVLVYLILNVLFASGVSSLNGTINDIKADLNNEGVNAHPLLTGVSGFLTLVGSSGAISSATGSALQSMLIVLESLVIIWALRHLLAGQRIFVKQAYYSAMTPLVPFLLVVFFIILQLLPVTLGSVALVAVAASLGTISGAWTVLLGVILFLLAAWSVYMLSASIFALYIVTLPDMQPREALRSARKLVKYRRWPILRRIVFLPVLLLLIMAAVIVPLILYATFLVAPVFYVLSMLTILFVHAYLYSLYRSLLA